MEVEESLKKRSDGLYQKSIRLPDGKRKCFYGRTQSELNRKILAYRNDLEQGRTFSAVADAWQEKHSTEVRWKTAESHIAPCNRAKAYFAGRLVKDITAPDVSAYIRSIEAKGLAKRTVQLHKDVLSMIFDYAIGTGTELLVNPCAAITLSPGLKQGSRSLPAKSDLDAIKAHAQDDRFSLLPFLLLYTGMRLGEALALRREDFDFKQNTITVNKKLAWVRNQPHIDHFTKTDRGVRVVPLLDPLKEALPEWDGYLFCENGLITNHLFRGEWSRYVKRTGVQCDRHCLRHQFVTMMYEAGVNAPEAATITGHDVSVMQQTYIHITKERQRQAAEKLNQYFKMEVKS